jgi:hypothetical protein
MDSIIESNTGWGIKGSPTLPNRIVGNVIESNVAGQIYSGAILHTVIDGNNFESTAADDDVVMLDLCNDNTTTGCSNLDITNNQFSPGSTAPYIIDLSNGSQIGPSGVRVENNIFSVLPVAINFGNAVDVTIQNRYPETYYTFGSTYYGIHFLSYGQMKNKTSRGDADVLEAEGRLKGAYFYIGNNWTPASKTAACTKGRVGGDASYIYYCSADNTIIRVAYDNTW